MRHLSGGKVVDGLVASAGTNALEVDVSASTGAYVDGQFTQSISATTKTLSTNGTTSTRTDTIYVSENGSIGVSEASTTAPSGTHKLAEADVSSSDSVSAVRNYAHDITTGIASEKPPSSPSEGDEWYDIPNQETKFYNGNVWESYIHQNFRQTDIPFSDIPNGDTATGLRFNVPSGKTLRVYEVGVQNNAGNAPAGLTVEVFDNTNAVSVGSWNVLHTEGEPLASISGNVNVSIRVENATGSAQNASGYVYYTMG